MHSYISKQVIVFIFTVLFAFSSMADWPNYRGPFADGHANDTTLPLAWSEDSNVAWKTEIPHSGLSTPVILEGRIWLTTATEEGHDFFAICVDATTGEILINKKVFHCAEPEPLGNNINGYASPSAVLEPGRVYVHFGSYGTACLDTATGEPIWKNDTLPCRHFRGPGSSPMIFEDLLILSFDGIDQQYVAALNKDTGELVWKTDRSTEWDDIQDDGTIFRDGDYRKAFSTPLVINVKGSPQLISLGAKAAFSYDPRTGKEIWKTHHGCQSASPQPLYDGERVYIITGHGNTALWAMNPEGKGDITDSHMIWKVEGKVVPKQPTPILVDGLIYMVSNDGAVTCLDAETGETVWNDRIGGTYMASPIYAGKHLYFLSMQGKTTILKAGRTFEEIAKNELDGRFLASPAVTGSALILRSKTHLYRIEEKPTQ